MNIKWLLFSTKGRLNRKVYWGCALVLCVISFVVITIGEEFGSVGLVILGAIIFLLLIAPDIKRLHDRNRSGWMILLLLMPLVNIWICIEILFLRGTAGDNNYGKDPLATE